MVEPRNENRNANPGCVDVRGSRRELESGGRESSQGGHSGEVSHGILPDVRVYGCDGPVGGDGWDTRRVAGAIVAGDFRTDHELARTRLVGGRMRGNSGV